MSDTSRRNDERLTYLRRVMMCQDARLIEVLERLRDAGISVIRINGNEAYIKQERGDGGTTYKQVTF